MFKKKYIIFVLLIIGALLITATIWVVLNKKSAVSSYAECIKQKSAKILESYPKQCVYGGKSFSNPSQSVTPPQTINTENWLTYVPDNESYKLKLVDGWKFTSTATDQNQEILTACAPECNYNPSTPATLVNTKGSYDKYALVKVASSKTMPNTTNYTQISQQKVNNYILTKYSIKTATGTDFLYTAYTPKVTVFTNYSYNSKSPDLTQLVEAMVSTIEI